MNHQTRLCISLVLLFLFSKTFSQDVTSISDERAFKITGNFGFLLSSFNSTGIRSQQSPFMWHLNGSPIVSIYGLMLPFSFTVSEQERSYRQPFNMIGVSPYYKWMTLHLGHRNIAYGNYTLAGHNILGAGFDIKHPSGIRAGFIGGRFNRAIGLDINPADTTLYTYIVPEYKRTGYSFKLGYGTDSTFVDLIFLKAKDHENSIEQTPALQYFNIKPAENAVLGLVGQHFFNSKLVLDLDYARSVFTQNSTDTLPGNELKGIASGLGNLIAFNSTTTSSSALESSLSYRNTNYGLRLRFQRIGDNYQSMGAYFFQNDLQNITIDPWVRILNRKMRVSGSLGFQTTNLNSEDRLSSRRVISAIRASYSPSHIYMVSVNFSNYEMERQRRFTTLDTIFQISQTTKNLGVNQNLNLQRDEFSHMFSMGYDLRNLRTRNDLPFMANSDYVSHTLYTSYNLSINPYNLGLETGYNFNAFVISEDINSANGFLVGIEKRMLKNTLRISVRQEWDTQIVNKEKYRNINKTRLNVSYALQRKHYINLRGYVISANSVLFTANDYRQTRFDLGYQFRF